MKSIFTLSVAIAATLTFATFGASAQSLTASNTNASIGDTGHAATVVFTNTSPETVGAVDFKLSYNDANLTLGSMSATDSGTACADQGGGEILCFMNPSGIDPLLKPSVTMTFNFDIGPTAGVEPLSISAVNAFDGSLNNVVLTVTDGQITITAAPPDVVVATSPAWGSTINFPAGVQGTNQAATLAVNVASGAIGTGTVNGCAITGADAGQFSITGGHPATVPPAGSIGLQATLTTAPLSATLTCTVTDAAAGSPATRAWTLAAPAGSPTPAPGFSATPAPGPINVGAPPNSTVTRTVTITNNGTAGPGSDLTLNCSVTGPDWSITTTPTSPLAVGASTTVVLSVTTPANVADPALTDTLVCNHNATGSPANYPLSATSALAPPATLVPATSLWSKLALFGLFGALGMLILGLRRSH